MPGLGKLLTLSQIAPGHLVWLFDSQQPEHGWRHIFQRAAFTQFYADRIFID